ncbi:hypothetical protein BDV06DRAFT_221057 [Aspergillus oleicola]
MQQAYDPRAVQDGKTANILFTVALAERYAKHGILAFAVHPGYIPSTSLLAYLSTLSPNEMNKISLQNTGHPFSVETPKSLEQGIPTTLVAAQQNVSYLADCQVAPVRAYARNRGLAGRLWGVSEGLVGEIFS